MFPTIEAATKLSFPRINILPLDNRGYTVFLLKSRYFQYGQVKMFKHGKDFKYCGSIR